MPLSPLWMEGDVDRVEASPAAKQDGYMYYKQHRKQCGRHWRGSTAQHLMDVSSEILVSLYHFSTSAKPNEVAIF